MKQQPRFLLRQKVGTVQATININHTEKEENSSLNENEMPTSSLSDFESNLQQNKATERKKENSDADENEKLTSSLADP